MAKFNAGDFVTRHEYGREELYKIMKVTPKTYVLRRVKMNWIESSIDSSMILNIDRTNVTLVPQDYRFKHDVTMELWNGSHIIHLST